MSRGQVFTLQLAEFAKRSGLAGDMVARDVAIRVFRDVILKSPVDTGRFRANWSVSIGLVPAGFVERAIVDPSGQTTMDEGVRMLAGYKMGSIAFVTNGLPYAVRLEYGYSDQAPQGMVRLTMARIRGQLDEIIAKARSETGLK